MRFDKVDNRALNVIHLKQPRNKWTHLADIYNIFG